MAAILQRLNSWQDFFATYWKLIYSVALKVRLSDEDARDVVQETVVQVAEGLRDGRWVKLSARSRLTSPRFTSLNIASPP